MGFEWIKMRAALLTDPKVMAIGRALESGLGQFSSWLTKDGRADVTLRDSALRHLVTGALHSVWCAANQHANNDTISNASFSWIDAISGITGFGEAMGSVGWARESGDGLVFPKFDDNNTSNAERQRKYRERKKQKRNETDVTRDVTDNVTRVVTGDAQRREEKRREEQEDNTPIPPTERKKRTRQVLAYCQTFESWWDVYPRREGKAKAFEAWKAAGAAIKSRRNCTSQEAADFLLVQTKAYATSPRAQWPMSKLPHPATWLNSGRYDDDPSAWDAVYGDEVAKAPDPASRVPTAEDLASYNPKEFD